MTLRRKIIYTTLILIVGLGIAVIQSYVMRAAFMNHDIGTLAGMASCCVTGGTMAMLLILTWLPY